MDDDRVSALTIQTSLNWSKQYVKYFETDINCKLPAFGSPLIIKNLDCLTEHILSWQASYRNRIFVFN